ncbi:MAG: hypothetical protein K5639_04800 [Eubacterium sp.]|nr:hypothetical protein [Eubacterium sp.]
MRNNRNVFGIILSCGVILSIVLSATACTSGEPESASDGEEQSYNRNYIEETLNLAENPDEEWTYNELTDSWVMSVTSAVAYPDVPEKQGVSVCVPGGFVVGIDTDDDGTEDVTASSATSPVKGKLVLDTEKQMVSTNGQHYTSETAPVILDTKMSEKGLENRTASPQYAKEGYICVSCGRRDERYAVADEKNAIRFVRYNILLGNLPGCADYFVTTGGTDAMLLASSGNSSDFYPYEVEAGAVGIYDNKDGTYTNTVVIDSIEMGISDSVWGCVSYSPLSSQTEAEMALAFEYYLCNGYFFHNSFRYKLADFLAKEYMNYINEKGLKISESDVNIDLNHNGDLTDKIDLTIEYDMTKYPDTRGYGGTYIDLYLNQFVTNLQWYLDNLSSAENITWFSSSGKRLSDAQVTLMSPRSRAQAYVFGRYAGADSPDEKRINEASISEKYSDYETMLSDYETDIQEIDSGDKFGKKLTELYDPIKHIGSKETESPAWTKIMIGAAETDISLFNSMNLQIALLDAGTDTKLEWQWNSERKPTEMFGESFSLYVDMMYAKHVDGAQQISPAIKQKQTKNGSAKKATGKNISDIVSIGYDGKASLEIKDVTAYRTSFADKAVPCFDEPDYGPMNLLFGDEKKEARHWDSYLLKAMSENKNILGALFENNNKSRGGLK